MKILSLVSLISNLKNRFKQFFDSIIGHFSVAAVLSLMLLIAGVIYDGNRTLNAALMENIRASAKQTAQILNLTVATYESADDLAPVREFFSEILEEHSENGLAYVIVCGADGRQLINTLGTNRDVPTPNNLDKLNTADGRTLLIHVRNPLLLPHKEVGFLQYGLSIKNLVEATAAEQRNSLIRTSFILLATLVAILILGLRISIRLKEMIRASKEIISGKYDHTIRISGQDELATLGAHFNHMSSEVKQRIREITKLNQTLEQRVSQRTAELKQANELLEKNISNLKSTQEKLIDSEKLAALGSLVAGVAHELNTPIGNALTVATSLAYNTTEIKEIYNNGQLKESTLKKYLRSLEEASNLLTVSISRASELIISFKTIAVDQTSELRREFNLLQLFNELQHTLRLQSKHKRIQLALDVDPSITMDSYPGPLTQVIANMYNNAFLHGFEGMEIGKVTISAKRSAENENVILLEFADNGKGILKQHLPRIFDPFFTTKLGQGGSGLGLHICYNIIYKVLGGSIDVKSSAKSGTRFLVTIPCVAPNTTQKDRVELIEHKEEKNEVKTTQELSVNEEISGLKQA
jgi:two-component system, NtrC family, sensor kinase